MTEDYDNLYYYKQEIRKLVWDSYDQSKAISNLLKTIVETQVYMQDTYEKKAIASSASGSKFIHVKMHTLLMVLYKLGVR